jgi:hypothetical protein
MALRVLLLAAISCVIVSPGRAQESQPAIPDAGTQEERKPLSAEDAQLVQQLALLQDVELLRNLDLFESKPADAAQAPDGGTAPPQQGPPKQ